jgi:hypothetical protein
MKRTADEQQNRRPVQASLDRRLHHRAESHARVTISYVAGRQFIMEDGRVTNLSREGMGVRGTRPLTLGTAVSLFIARPDADDDLCIPEAQVSWSSGCWFGLTISNLKPETEHELLTCLASHHP